MARIEASTVAGSFMCVSVMPPDDILERPFCSHLLSVTFACVFELLGGGGGNSRLESSEHGCRILSTQQGSASQTGPIVLLGKSMCVLVAVLVSATPDTAIVIAPYIGPYELQ